MVRII